MLSYGMHIDQMNDPLQKIEIEMIVHKIKNPKAEFVARIEQLRQIRLIDEKQYRRQKTGLPYFCCGIFNPPLRKKENFTTIDSFTLDFDHFSDGNISKEEIKERLRDDYHIRLLFTTPSGDGLKALFLLSEPCSDPGKYTHFYKAFAQKFSQKYGLEKVTDWVTHDAARATFFSADTEAWDNPIATPVKMNDYISETIGSEFLRIEKGFNEFKKENSIAEKTPGTGTPDEVTLTFIKSKLNPHYRPRKEKNIFIPNELEDVLPLVKESLDRENIQVASVSSINYGKQIRVQVGALWGEINIFFSQKRGYSVIRSTKTGCNKDLSDLAYQIVDSLLN